jgi:thiol-disulfide isomerase/thioredoxin
MDQQPGPPDERPWRRREYSGAASTLGVAALVILSVGLAIWYFEFAGGSTSPVREAGFGIVALPEDANPTGEAAVAREGRAAPNFRLRSIHNDEHTLLDFRGNYVVLNFWASWCGPCRTETPLLQDFHTGNASKNVIVVGINQQEDIRTARDFAEEFEVSYPVLLDLTGQVSEGYRVSTGLPVTVILDPDGVVLRVHYGPVTIGDLEAMLEGHVF